MKACFFARVRDPRLFDVVEFYHNDIRALRELGFDVVTASRFSDVPWNADLYYTWWWGPGALSLGKSLPLHRPNIFTGTLQLNPSVGWWEAIGPAKQMLVRTCLKLASANLATCDVELAYLHHLGAPRASRVYQGIDTSRYRPGPRPHPERAKTILTLSHLTTANVQRKRITTVVRAIPAVLARHPDARFVIAGAHDTGYRTLLDLSRALGVDGAVSFPGSISLDEKLALYGESRVFAQPTIYEGFGVAHAEAMASGLPVVTSPRGAIPEVVGNCARFVDPDDDVAVAREINTLLDEPVAAEAFGATARARIESLFSYERRRAALGDVVARVLGS